MFCNSSQSSWRRLSPTLRTLSCRLIRYLPPLLWMVSCWPLVHPSGLLPGRPVCQCSGTMGTRLAPKPWGCPRDLGPGTLFSVFLTSPGILSFLLPPSLGLWPHDKGGGKRVGWGRDHIQIYMHTYPSTSASFLPAIPQFQQDSFSLPLPV